MLDRELSSKATSEGVVEAQQGWRRRVAEPPCQSFYQLGADPCRPELFALEAQEDSFIERIDPAEPLVELQPVDHESRRTKLNMLGTQISMPIHDSTAGDTGRGGPGRKWAPELEY